MVQRLRTCLAGTGGREGEGQGKTEKEGEREGRRERERRQFGDTVQFLAEGPAPGSLRLKDRARRMQGRHLVQPGAR